MARGQLRIYLGAAPGVGKTYAMLNEGHRRKQRGADVVVALVETHGRENTKAQLRDLEVIPRRTVTYRDKTFEEMDLAAVLRRAPAIALVDELAHTNVPGSGHEKRWQDVDELLDAGIDVISTLNIQHLESVNDVVERITGVHQSETIPDQVVRSAEQVELVDMTPEALRRRMAHGNIYGAEKVDAALGNYFREGNLGALRELALLWVADRVDEALHDYMVDHGIEGPWETRERVLVAMTGVAGNDQLIRRAARMARRTKGDLIGLHVRQSDGLASRDPALLEEHRQLLQDLGGTYHEIIGHHVAHDLATFARTENITQLVMGATRRSRWTELWRGSVINRVVRELGSIDVHVISPDVDDHAEHIPPARRMPSALSVRRRLIGWIVGMAGLLLLTAALASLRDDVDESGRVLLYLALVMVVATIGGTWPAVVTAAGAFLALNWYFTEPYYTLTVGSTQNQIALAVFLLVAATVSVLVTVAARRALEAQRARSEAEALARVAASLVGDDDPLDAMTERLRTTFALDGVSLLQTTDGDTTVLAHSGPAAPRRPDEPGIEVMALTDDAVLALHSRTLDVEDRIVLKAFAAQLTTALQRRELRAEAAEASTLAEADALRTALLRAVSHDLRTPLASIKASVTSLLQDDIEWPPDATNEFLQTIDEETDRLDRLVGNLLDMSRLQTGAVQPVKRTVGLDEVVPAALASISGRIDNVVVDVSEQLPSVQTDPALVERALANLVTNALAASPADEPVRIEAGEVGDHIHLRVVDRGPGVAPEQRARLFEPFQRLGDESNGSGVGLGLAVARGLVAAVGGELSAEDTPGGGLTMVIALPEMAR